MKNIFNNNLHLLENLFGKNLIAERRNRLLEIFKNTEQSWYNNLDRIKNKKIECLLIAEAPPWSENGTPRYFYNKIESSYHKRIWKTFFPFKAIPTDNEQAFNMLIDNKFLLIDSLPYAMNYKGKRNNENYQKLVKECICWWKEKLTDEKIGFTENVKISFAFKVNGNSIIKALNGRILLQNTQTIELNKELIAADRSGYTNSERLREIFKLNYYI